MARVFLLNKIFASVHLSPQRATVYYGGLAGRFATARKNYLQRYATSSGELTRL